MQNLNIHMLQLIIYTFLLSMCTDQTGMQCFLEYCPKSTMVQECKGILHVESYMHLAVNFLSK